MATAPKGKTQWLAGGGIAQAGGRSALLVLAQALGSKPTGTRTAAHAGPIEARGSDPPRRTALTRRGWGGGRCGRGSRNRLKHHVWKEGGFQGRTSPSCRHSAPDSGTEQPSFFAKWTDNQRRSCVSSGGYHRYADHPSISPEQQVRLSVRLKRREHLEFRGAFTEIEHALSGGQPVSSGVMRAAQQVCSGASLAMATSGLRGA